MLWRWSLIKKYSVSRSFSMGKRSGREENAPDSLFDIASITEVVTSCGIMQLVEKDLITLDDPIRNHVRDLCPF